jgi:HlyD family secretion protein
MSSRAPRFLVVLCASCTGGHGLPYSGFVDEPVSSVATQTSGKILAIQVREGDRVKKGEVLVELEASDRRAAVQQAFANVERARQLLRQAQGNLRAATPAVKGAAADIARAQAALDEARLDDDRARKLQAQGAIPSSDLELAHSRLLQAEAAVDGLVAAEASTHGRLIAAEAAVSDARAGLWSAEAALQLAQAQLEQTTIEAPFDGLGVSRNFEVGEWAAPGSPLITMEDTSRPWVRLDVEETQFGSLTLGMPAQIRLVAMPDHMLTGHVVLIGAEGDFALNRDVKRGRADIRTFLVRVAFDEQPELLRPGMTAEVQLLDAPQPPPSPAPQALRRASW